MGLEVLNRYVLRSTLKPFKGITKRFEIEDVELKLFLKELTNSAVLDAIYIASPSLYKELQSWLGGGIKDRKDQNKLYYSLLKYFSRMETRCTPFGLFAGCGVGNINNKTHIVLSNIETHKRHTRLDMNFLCALSQDLSNQVEFRQNLTYFPNTSLYISADKYRYVEYHYENSRRLHRIVSFDKSIYIDSIMNKAKEGSTLNDLIACLVSDDISETVASEFVNELIKNQVIVSDLEPSATGPEHLDYILWYLKNKNILPELRLKLEQISEKLLDVDNNGTFNSVESYEEIISLIEQTGTSYDIKYLFQTDLFLSTENNTISNKLPEMVMEGVKLLLKFNRRLNENNLQKFKKVFFDRYEEQEVSLSSVLDPEIGLGYPLNDLSLGDLNPLVDGIKTYGKKGITQYDIKWNSFQSYLFKKYNEAIKKDLFEVNIEDNEIDELTKDYPPTEALGDTFSVMIKVLEADIVNDVYKIEMNNIGGSTGAYLLGRFCYGDSEILDLTNQITKIENEYVGDAIIAEIIHLPESRTGNVILRPSIRDFEIPYLARSSVDKNFQLSIDDLFLSVWNNKIILRSKSLNKIIIPRLTNAHNYSYNALPIYHFLCDLQSQDFLNGIDLTWGVHSNEYPFLPRIVYKNIVFSLATWNIIVAEVKNIFEEKEIDKLLENINNWRQINHLPQWIMLSEGDNELFIDLNIPIYIQMLWDAIKNKLVVQFKEFLFNPEKPLVKGMEGWHTNEIILIFKNGEQV
ncbi:MAG: lantibiotic dehydratase family protein [Bacteroidota bacterium]